MPLPVTVGLASGSSLPAGIPIPSSLAGTTSGPSQFLAQIKVQIIDTVRQITSKQHAILDEEFKSPFIDYIRHKHVPSNFTITNLPQYNGTFKQVFKPHMTWYSFVACA